MRDGPLSAPHPDPSPERAPDAEPRQGWLPTRPAPFDGGIDLIDLLRSLWRAKLLLVGCVAGMMMITGLVVRQLTPQYTGHALLLVGTPPANIVDLEAVISGVSADADAVASEIEALRAYDLIAELVVRLDLDEEPKLNPSLQPKSAVTEAWNGAVRFVVGVVAGSGGRTTPLSEEERLAQQEAAVVGNVLERLDVFSRERSRLVDVTFTSEDPVLAADVVNTLLALYMEDQVESKYAATVRATEWLSENVGSWRERTLESERQIEKFRSKEGLLETDGVLLVARQLAEINSQLEQARLARATAEARLHQLEQQGQESGAASFVGAERSPVVQFLREQEANLLRTEFEMRTNYGPEHPRLANVRTELEELQARIAEEVARTVDGLRVEVEAARTVEHSIEQRFQQLMQEVAAANMSQVGLQALQREADANRMILQVFMTRLAETRGQSDRDILQPDARVISGAGVPIVPSFPKTKLYLALAFLVSTFGGVLLVFVLAWLRPGFGSSGDVERVTGVPVLGLVPESASGRTGYRKVAVSALEHEPSTFSDSLRWMGASLLLLDGKPRSLLVTSSQAAEGKTTAVVYLARAADAARLRVVVVDADFYQARLHTAFDIPQAPGLIDFLAGRATLDEVVHEDKTSGVHVVPVGLADPHSPPLIGAANLQRLLHLLERTFDLILIDGPPILEAPEARVLAAVSDTTLFAIRWTKTGRQTVKTAFEQIEQSGGRIAGVLMTRVNVKKFLRYGDADAHRYFGSMKRHRTGLAEIWARGRRWVEAESAPTRAGPIVESPDGHEKDEAASREQVCAAEPRRSGSDGRAVL